MNVLVIEFRYLALLITECQRYAGTGRLVCQSGTEQNTLYYQLGKLVHAESSSQSGAQPLSQLLRWQEGQLHFEPGNTTIKRSLSSQQEEIFLQMLVLLQKRGVLESLDQHHPFSILATKAETENYVLGGEAEAKQPNLDELSANLLELDYSYSPSWAKIGAQAQATPKQEVSDEAIFELDLDLEHRHPVISKSEPVVAPVKAEETGEFDFETDDFSSLPLTNSNPESLAKPARLEIEGEFDFEAGEFLPTPVVASEPEPAKAEETGEFDFETDEFSALPVASSKPEPVVVPTKVEEIDGKFEGAFDFEVGELSALPVASSKPEPVVVPTKVEISGEFDFEVGESSPPPITYSKPEPARARVVVEGEFDFEADETSVSLVAEAQTAVHRSTANPGKRLEFDFDEIAVASSGTGNETEFDFGPRIHSAMVALIEATSTPSPTEPTVNKTVVPQLEETDSFSFEPTVTPRREEVAEFRFEAATPLGIRARTEETTFSFDSPSATPSGLKARTEKTTEFSFDLPAATTVNAVERINTGPRVATQVNATGAGKSLEFDFEQALTSGSTKEAEETEFDFEPQIHNAMVAVIEATSTHPPTGAAAYKSVNQNSGKVEELVNLNMAAYSPVTSGNFLPRAVEERVYHSKFFRLAQTNLPPATMTKLKQDISFVAHYNGPKPDLSWLVKRVAVVELEGYMIIDRRKENYPYYAMLFFQYGLYVVAAFDDGNQIVESEVALQRLFQAEPPALSQITVGRVTPGLLNAYFALELPAPDKLSGLLCREINVRERVNWLAYNRFTGALKFYTSNRVIFYLMHEGQGLGGYEVVDGVMQNSTTPLDYFVAEPNARLDVHPAPTKKPLPNWAFS